MKFKSEAFTQASGSIGGTTYSRNRGGMYRRARAIPVNPNSVGQQRVRSIFSSLAAAWKDVLTVGQRDQWTAYAISTPAIDVLGDPITYTGQQMFIRCNSVRMNAGADMVADGPSTSGLLSLSPPDLKATAGSVTISVEFDDSDSWANEDNGGMVIQVSRQVSPAINYFKGPYRIATLVDGSGTSAPTSPNVSANPFGLDYEIPNKVFSRYTAFGADGRLSNVTFDKDIVLP